MREEGDKIGLSTLPSKEYRPFGFIYMTQDEIKEEFYTISVQPVVIPIIYNRFDDELETLEQWLNKEVYKFHISELDESLGGFYGRDHEANCLLDEAKSIIDWKTNPKYS